MDIQAKINDSNASNSNSSSESISASLHTLEILLGTKDDKTLSLMDSV